MPNVAMRQTHLVCNFHSSEWKVSLGEAVRLAIEIPKPSSGGTRRPPLEYLPSERPSSAQLERAQVRPQTRKLSLTLARTHIRQVKTAETDATPTAHFFRTLGPGEPPKARKTHDSVFHDRYSQHAFQHEIVELCVSHRSASGSSAAKAQESFNNWNDLRRAVPRCLIASLWHLTTVELPCLRTSSIGAESSSPSRHHLARKKNGD